MTRHGRESCLSELELATADGGPVYKRAKSQHSTRQRFKDKPPKGNGAVARRKSTENKERAYVAASRRSDRSIEARLESARRASEIHEERTGKALIVSEAIVLNDEMYEEEDKSMPQRYRRLSLQAAEMPGATRPRRCGSHPGPGPAASNCPPEWNTDIDKLFAQYFPGAEASLRRHSSEVLLLSPQAQAQAQAQTQTQVQTQAQARAQTLAWPSGSGVYQPQQQQLEMPIADGLLSEISMQTSMSPPPASLPSSFPALGIESGFPHPALGSQGLLGRVVLDPGKLPTPPEDAENALNASTVTTMPAATAAAHCLTLDPAALHHATVDPATTPVQDGPCACHKSALTP